MSVAKDTPASIDRLAEAMEQALAAALSGCAVSILSDYCAVSMEFLIPSMNMFLTASHAS